MALRPRRDEIEPQRRRIFRPGRRRGTEPPSVLALLRRILSLQALQIAVMFVELFGLPIAAYALWQSAAANQLTAEQTEISRKSLEDQQSLAAYSLLGDAAVATSAKVAALSILARRSEPYRGLVLDCDLECLIADADLSAGGAKPFVISGCSFDRLRFIRLGVRNTIFSKCSLSDVNLDGLRVAEVAGNGIKPLVYEPVEGLDFSQAGDDFDDFDARALSGNLFENEVFDLAIYRSSLSHSRIDGPAPLRVLIVLSDISNAKFCDAENCLPPTLNDAWFRSGQPPFGITRELLATAWMCPFAFVPKETEDDIGLYTQIKSECRHLAPTEPLAIRG